jgi:L-iditol 2-dehydrogenase
MTRMRAIVKRGTTVAVQRVPRPDCGATEVVIGMRAAGLCRTDLYVAQGKVPSADPVILGHEFAGVVEQVGAEVREFRLGQRVAAMPVLQCGECDRCRLGDTNTCLDPTMLGVHRHGAFAEAVAVPACNVYPVPDEMPFASAAYAEPVAAALGVLNAGLNREHRGLLLGRNRFAELLRQVFQVHGFHSVSLHDPRNDPKPPASSFDFVVETGASTAILQEAVRLVRPHGTIVLRSRNPDPVGLIFPAAIAKELTFRAVNYGPFVRGIALLAEGQLDLGPLLNATRRLEEFEQVFEAAGQHEATKFFFAP